MSDFEQFKAESVTTKYYLITLVRLKSAGCCDECLCRQTDPVEFIIISAQSMLDSF